MENEEREGKIRSSLELRSEVGSGGSGSSANQVYLSVNSECKAGKVAKESEGERDRRGTMRN